MASIEFGIIQNEDHEHMSDHHHQAKRSVPAAGTRGTAAAAEVSLIAELPNLGPKSQQMLVASGIQSVAQLRELGSVAAYAMVKARHKSASLNLLWALEGALCGMPWQEVAREHRTSLLLNLEARLQNGG
jgi:DNA transformation protein